MSYNKVTTGKIYFDYDDIIKSVEAWINKANPSIPRCDSTQIKMRLAQRVVELTNEECVQKLIQHYNNPDRLDTLPEVLAAGGLQVNTKSGWISISLKQYLKNIVLFVLPWSHLLFYVIVSLFRRSPQQSTPATLLMEAGGGYEGCDFSFVKFCRSGLVAPLSSASKIIIKTKTPPKTPTDSDFVYVPQPLVYFITHNLSLSDKLKLLIKHIFAPFTYLLSIMNCSLNVVLGRDLSLIPVVKYLDDKRLIDSVIITTSQFAAQPLWMKGLESQHFKLHMVWYSQNFIPKMYIGETKRSDLPAARHMRVDVHWVWTDGFRDYLKGLGQKSTINVVGPILWYMPESVNEFDEEYINIVAFDITPIPDDRTAFGAAKNYYSVATISKFVSDIIKVCGDIADETGKKVRVYLKHKRRPKDGHHDSTYLEFLERLEQENKNFKLIDHQSNLFGLLDKCNLSISVPYTSTTYVAASLSRYALFYDPYAELIPKYEKNKYVHFASGPDELAERMRTYLDVSERVKFSNIQ